jgi:hypothetical protein
MSEFKEVSAVEWLIDKLKQYDVGVLLLKLHKEEIDQANKMFEQQMCQFAFDYNDEFINNGQVPTAEQYYNETYGKKNKQ